MDNEVSEKKEKNKKFSDFINKDFNIDDFYRRLGVWLLVLLLVLISFLGSLMLYMQKQILKRTEAKFVEKSEMQVIYIDRSDNSVIEDF